MSLVDNLPTSRRSLDVNSISGILWIFGLGFAGVITLLLLLQRLGLPMVYVVGITSITTVISGVILSWLGRTMTSSLFFFANKSAGASHLGIGGATDWIGGTFLIIFFSIPLVSKMILSTSLILGLILFAALFANAFWRSGVLTLPGFIAWRSRSQLAGHLSLIVVIGILGCFILSEFQIARDSLVILGGVEFQTGTWLVLALALLPSLSGGWFALMIANAVLAIWMLICVLLPAVVTGFVPQVLAGNLLLDQNIGTLPALTLESVQAGNPLLLESNQLAGSAPGLFATIFVLAAGFSVVPQALSRVALNIRAVDALESVAWSALCLFLIISALPLSIGLISITPSSSSLSVLLESQPVLHTLPYFALLFSSMNALAVVLFSISNTIVRGIRRSRKLDPGEQSIFSTRLISIIIGVSIINIPSEIIPPPDQLMIWALVVGAGCLFIPMAAGAWISNLPRYCLAITVLCGAAATITLLIERIEGVPHNPIIASGAGIVCGTIIVLISRLYSALRTGRPRDPLQYQLRDPELNN